MTFAVVGVILGATEALATGILCLMHDCCEHSWYSVVFDILKTPRNTRHTGNGRSKWMIGSEGYYTNVGY